MSQQQVRTCLVEEVPLLDVFGAAALHEADEHLCMLESRGDLTSFGRYSFLCSDPFLIFRSKRERAFAGPPGDVRERPGPPLAELQALLTRYGSLSGWHPDLPPFLGGAVGYLGYELLYLLEAIPDLGRDDLQLPDAYLAFFNTVIATDRLRSRSWIIVNAFDDDEDASKKTARERMDRYKARVGSIAPRDATDTTRDYHRHRDEVLRSRRLTEELLIEAGIRPVVNHASYVGMVKTAKEHILAGDVFELCTTNRFDTTYSGRGIDLYEALREVNLAPFSAYLRFGEVEVACSSPERFMSLNRDRWAETRPIKGTRPRGKTTHEDDLLRRDLSTHEKDQAENIMITDVARNDLGRVCEFGSVGVPELRVVESYSFTHQLVSTVRGRVRKDVGALDLLRASFPGGSITGAPKVEAMKLIDALEPVKRGIFSGSIGYIDYDGSFDFNIVIRTLVKKGEVVTFHVGGAVVADSDPEEEYQETLDKAHGLVTALELVGAGKRR